METFISVVLFLLVGWLFVRLVQDANKTHEHFKLVNDLRLRVIAALIEGDKHPREIVKWIEKECLINPLESHEGLLFPVLHRMEEEGMVKSYIDESTGRVRRIYHLIRDRV